jgi:hypothetical protein
MPPFCRRFQAAITPLRHAAISPYDFRFSFSLTLFAEDMPVIRLRHY